MRDRRWPREIIERAKRLRKEEKSFHEISQEVGVAKSTLFTWIGAMERSEKFKNANNKERLKEIRPLAIKKNKEKYQKIALGLENKVKEEVKNITCNDSTKRAMLAMLYWAEGAKTEHDTLAFANTDPELLLLFITLLRDCYPLDETKFRVRVHLHDYHNEAVAKSFWSSLLNIPLERFGKTYWKQRSKEKTSRRNFGGICFIRYNSVYLRREVMHLAHFLQRRITGDIYVPVA